MIKIILREPIFHFLIIGALLHIAYSLLNQDTTSRDNDKNIIVVNDSILRNLLNIRNKNPLGNFDVNAALASLDNKEKEELVAEYVEEEALYRMALKMGLNENDFIIKRRMIQKLLFLLEDLNTSQIEISDDKLFAYYEAHNEEFKTSDKISFTHIFLSFDQHGDNTRDKAGNLLAFINDKRVDVSEASSHGDRFPLNHMYTQVTPTQTTSYFGNKFSTALFELEQKNEWQGPIESGYGYHLVYINARESGRIPAFNSIRNQVTESYLYREKFYLNKLTREGIVEKFSVIREYE